jgi:ATP-dependent Clp protease ATP-binding subunit ClpA
MPKVNVYLPVGLATAVREAGVPISAVCQRALERVLADVRATPAMPERPSPFGMYGRFLQRARHALELSYEAALARGHEWIESEDLLLGILQQGSNFAVHIVEVLGISPDDIVLRVYDSSPPGEFRSANRTLDSMLSQAVRTALSIAARQAVATHPERRYIGCEELLYGLAAAPGTVGSRILGEFDIHPAAIERVTREHLEGWIAADRSDLNAADDPADTVPNQDDGGEARAY